MKILGVDPGLKATGYGVIEVDKDRRVKLLEAGTIEPKQTDLMQKKIDVVYSNLKNVILRYSPETMVLEKLYSHYKRPTIACIMGHVRGVICLLCSHENIGLEEYSVKRIRKALLGNGNATKYQTMAAVSHILHIDQSKLTLDASDALALALGYVYMKRVIN